MSTKARMSTCRSAAASACRVRETVAKRAPQPLATISSGRYRLRHRRLAYLLWLFCAAAGVVLVDGTAVKNISFHLCATGALSRLENAALSIPGVVFTPLVGEQSCSAILSGTSTLLDVNVWSGSPFSDDSGPLLIYGAFLFSLPRRCLKRGTMLAEQPSHVFMYGWPNSCGRPLGESLPVNRWQQFWGQTFAKCTHVSGLKCSKNHQRAVIGRGPWSSISCRESRACLPPDSSLFPL
jgi:hypothetical protein